MVLAFDPERRRQPLERPTEYGCRHLLVTLDDEAKTVTCRACQKSLDPFWYLTLLAREWGQRAYRDDRARTAYAALEQQRRDGMARGRLFQRPTEGPGARAWQVFTNCFGRDPFSIYRRGNTWYAAEEDGSHISEDCAAMEIRRRRREALLAGLPREEE